MALLSPQEVTLAGITPSYGAVAASDTFVPGDDIFLHVKNGGGSSDTVAVATPVTYRGQAVADVSVSVPNGQERMIGPFPAQDFADPTTGLATVTHSFTTSVTCALIKATRR